MKILSGTYSTYEGTVIYDRREVRFRSENDALEAGISIVPQELSYVPQLTVEENILLGRRIGVNPYGWLDKSKRRSVTEQYIEELGLDLDAQTKMGDLSVAQCQMVEIIKAISRNSKVIIMDEPTSALTDVETGQLMRQIGELKKKGVSIVYISHKLNEIFEICDHITVLRDSKLIGSLPADQIKEDEVIEMMVGRKVSELYPPVIGHGEEELLRVEHFSQPKVFNDISFTLKKGEILGIAGMMGAGRSEIMRAIFGMDPHSSGTLILEGVEVKIKMPFDAIKNGIVMVPEDRAERGFVGGLSIKDNITLPNGDLYAPKLFLDQKKIVQDVEHISQELKIKAPDIEEHVINLSGGNQQKVVLAKWLVRGVKVLILDEPTRGIDIGAKQEIYKLISRYAQAGMGVIFISSEMQEVIGVSHRILVVDGGRILGEFSHDQVSQNSIMEMIIKRGRKKHEEKNNQRP